MNTRNYAVRNYAVPNYAVPKYVAPKYAVPKYAVPKHAVAVASLASALTLVAGLGAGPALANTPMRTPAITPVPLSGCGPIAAPGTYALTVNPPPSAGNCFVISAPHVTLDLAGHIVAGLGPGAGIAIAPGAVGAKVESTLPGATIGGFSTGIRDDADNSVIAGPNLRVAGNLDNGVWVVGANGGAVDHLIATGNHHYGIHLQLSLGIVISADMVNGSGTYGIWVQTSEGTRVLNSVVDGSRGAGIYLGCSGTGNLQNVSCGRPSDKSDISANTLVSNGDYGIAISDESLTNVVTTNHVSGDIANDLQDENFHCVGAAGTNIWSADSGTRNQSVSASCIG
jgi:Right handed beta helix region